MSYDSSLPPRTTKNTPARAPKPGPSKKGPRVGRIIFSFLALMILGLAVYAGYLYVKAERNLDKVADPDASSVPSNQRAQVKPIGLLVLGLDHRKETGSMNTDVMMAAVFNPVSKTATVVSIPRDSDLALEGYKTQKANAFYARFLSIARRDHDLSGDDAREYASKQMNEMMSQFFDVPIDYTAVIDFQGFIDFVDALNGVTVDVDQDMRYWDKADGTDIDLKKGVQNLNGEDALGFVRYRQSKNGETRASSDFERNDRQDRLLGAIVDELKSFSTFTKVGDLLDSVGDNMNTDIPKDQITNMIKTYFGINKSDVRFIALTGEWKKPHVVLDQDKLEEAKRALKEELQPEGRTSGAAASNQGGNTGSGG